MVGAQGGDGGGIGEDADPVTRFMDLERGRAQGFRDALRRRCRLAWPGGKVQHEAVRFPADGQ